MIENRAQAAGLLYGRDRMAKTELARTMRRAPTQAEAMLWFRLRGNRLGGHHFRRQQVIDDYIVDFYCAKAKLVVELDGEIHASSTAYDRERDRNIAQRGIHILRFSNNDMVRRTEYVLSEIKRIAAERSNQT